MPADVVDYANAVDLLFRQLRLYVECADALYVVAEKVDAVRQLVGE